MTPYMHKLAFPYSSVIPWTSGGYKCENVIHVSKCIWARAAGSVKTCGSSNRNVASPVYTVITLSLY